MAKKVFKTQEGLVQALNDTVSSARNHAGELHVDVIPIRRIELDPDNPRNFVLSFEDVLNDIDPSDPLFERKKTERDSLTSIVNSIHSQGVINPITVYKKGENYRLIAGERRTLGSILAGKTDIQAKILPNKPDIYKLSLIQWIENMEREDLTLWERMRNLEKIISAHCENHNTTNVSATELASIVGCSIPQAFNYSHLLQASEDLKGYIERNQIKNLEKVALIVKAPREIEKVLIQECINGVSLEKLKKLASGLDGSKKATKKVVHKNRGRVASSISLGKTTNIKVAKLIMESLLGNKDFHYLNSIICDVRWEDYGSVNLAFKKVIKELEKIEN